MTGNDPAFPVVLANIPLNSGLTKREQAIKDFMTAIMAGPLVECIDEKPLAEFVAAEAGLFADAWIAECNKPKGETKC